MSELISAPAAAPPARRPPQPESRVLRRFAPDGPPPWHRVADVVERVTAFAGEVPTLLAMRPVSHTWLGAVRRRAVDAHDATATGKRSEDPFVFYDGPRVACGVELGSFSHDAPQSQRMFFVAMAMLCEVDAPSAEEQESDDPAVAAAAEADLVLKLCARDFDVCHACSPCWRLWTLRCNGDGARRLRGHHAVAWSNAPSTLQNARRLRWFASDITARMDDDQHFDLTTAAPMLEGLFLHRGSVSLPARVDSAMPWFPCGLAKFRHLHTLHLQAGTIAKAATLLEALTHTSLRNLSIESVQLHDWNSAVCDLEASGSRSLISVLRVYTFTVGSRQVSERPTLSVELPSAVFPNLRHADIGRTEDEAPFTGVLEQLAACPLETFCGDLPDAARDHVPQTVQRLRPYTMNDLVSREAAASWFSRLPEPLEGLDVCEGWLASTYLRDGDTSGLRRLSATVGEALSTTDRGRNQCAFDASLPCAADISLKVADWPDGMAMLFRNLGSLCRLSLTSEEDDVEPDAIPPDTLWRSLPSAVNLEEFEVRNLPDLPALDPAQIPPASLPALRRVAISHCRGLLEEPATWGFIAALPNLTDLEVDATASIISIAASAFGTVRADADDAPPPGANIRRLSLYGHVDPDAFADARDASDQNYAHFLSRFAELRELDISNWRGCDCTCLAALPRPELLHTLSFEVAENVTFAQIIPRIGVLAQLRYLRLEFASERWPEDASIVDVLPALSEKCPLLRTVRIKPSTEFSAARDTSGANWKRLRISLDEEWTRAMSIDHV